MLRWVWLLVLVGLAGPTVAQAGTVVMFEWSDDPWRQGHPVIWCAVDGVVGDFTLLLPDGEVETLIPDSQDCASREMDQAGSYRLSFTDGAGPQEVVWVVYGAPEAFDAGFWVQVFAWTGVLAWSFFHAFYFIATVATLAMLATLAPAIPFPAVLAVFLLLAGLWGHAWMIGRKEAKELA